MGILQTTKEKVFAVLFGIVIVLSYWPGSLRPLIGLPYDTYEPVFFGWMPGWFFYQLVMYALFWVLCLLFSIFVLFPGVEEKK